MGRPQAIACGHEQDDQHGRGGFLQLAHAAYDATPVRRDGRAWIAKDSGRACRGWGPREIAPLADRCNLIGYGKRNFVAWP
jgi:hypothetical protein